MYKKILELSKSLKSKFIFDYDTKNITWFKAGGKADVYCLVDNISDLQIILKNIENIPFVVVGAGSNLLVRDSGYKGIIIKLGKMFNNINLNNSKIIAGASILDSNLSKFALLNSIKNLEFYSGIPGSIGGAIKMNAGCFGYETKDIVNKVTIIEKNGKIKNLENKSLNFGYRNSNINEEIIISVEFNAEYGEKDLIQKKIQEIKDIRNRSQPIKNKTGGSTFKNPKNYYAAELIEKSGCKGLKVGDAIVSNKHSNFIINSNNASATDIENLGKMIVDKVYKNFNVILDWEIKIIGEDY